MSQRTGSPHQAGTAAKASSVKAPAVLPVIGCLEKPKRKLKQLLRKEALAAFAEWQRKPDKIPY